jgi:Protein of unknown function (DUF3761)
VPGGRRSVFCNVQNCDEGGVSKTMRLVVDGRRFNKAVNKLYYYSGQDLLRLRALPTKYQVSIEQLIQGSVAGRPALKRKSCPARIEAPGEATFLRSDYSKAQTDVHQSREVVIEIRDGRLVLHTDHASHSLVLQTHRTVPESEAMRREPLPVRAAKTTGKGVGWVLVIVAVNLAIGLVGFGVKWVVDQSGPSYSGPPGATAVCEDGTISYSSHHSGTCSWHGGVQAWNPDR